MPIINFNSQVLSAFGLPPVSLSFSLSGGSGTPKTVELLTVGTIGGKQVEGVAFNALTSPASGTGVWSTLSAATGTSFRVDRAYVNTTMSIVFTDGSSSIFSVVTGASTTVQSLTANGFDSVFPESRRKWILGYY
jgi:hypothetical protein